MVWELKWARVRGHFAAGLPLPSENGIHLLTIET